MTGSLNADPPRQSEDQRGSSEHQRAAHQWFKPHGKNAREYAGTIPLTHVAKSSHYR
jgi:hypothetical protein